MADLPPAVRRQPDGAHTLTLHVQPGAKRSGFAGLHGEALKVRLAAPPVEGKANACLQAFFAEALGLPKRAVSLVSGETSRQKVLRIEGADEAALLRLLSDEG